MACAGITQRAQRCARFSEAAKTHLTNRAVMLSGALQRNAKHEARLSNISVYFRSLIGQI
jgi:hypothetical protein